MKLRGNGMSLFATLFHAKTDEVNVDVTTSPIVAKANSYRSNGLELEGVGEVRSSSGCLAA